MVGWLFFALVTGLFYGRATRPKAYIDFSHNALIAPYRDGWALMFRTVPYKANHLLTNANAVVSLSLLNTEKQQYDFYTLSLERSHVDSFSMNWTIVHPIDADSPLLNLTAIDMEQADIELIIQITGFDQVFSNTVMARTSYTFHEIVHQARFTPMYHTTEDGTTTILELDKLNSYIKL
jgi:inward rectifier potassium channel